MELKKQKNYQQAFEMACASLRNMDMEERANKAGAIYRRKAMEEKIIVHFFSEPYALHVPSLEFDSPSKKAISLVTRVLLLHYLLGADGSPVEGRWVNYKDIPGGLLYAGVFERRVTEPLARRFGTSGRRFQEIGLRSGGTPVAIGDACFTLHALPRIPLQYVLWQGDEEFPAKVQLLFDASANHYLSLEDIVVLGQMATGRLIHLSSPASFALST